MFCFNSQASSQSVDKPRVAVLTLRNRIELTKNHQLKLEAHAFTYNTYDSFESGYYEEHLTGLYIAYVYKFWLFNDWLFIGAGFGADQA